jgi:hypothetical protein
MWGIKQIHDLLIIGLVSSFENSRDYIQSNMLMEYINQIESADPSVIDRLEKAFEDNPQVYRTRFLGHTFAAHAAAPTSVT